MKLAAMIHVGKTENNEKVLSQASTGKVSSFNSELPQGNKLSLKIRFSFSLFSLLLRKKGGTGRWAATRVFSLSFTVRIAFVPTSISIKMPGLCKTAFIKITKLLTFYST